MDAKKKKKQIRPSGFPVPVARMYQQGPETNYNSLITNMEWVRTVMVLTLLGNVKKHMTNLSEARARAAQKAREFPATFVHGAKLSAINVEIVLRENVDVIRRGNVCQI